MSFGAALSGLNAASADLGVIANNIANASTTGFKKSRAEFADVYAASSGSNAIGTGTRLAGVSQQFTQGTVAFTDNSLDLAVNGGGFFTLNDNGSSVYARSGSFQVDRDGYIANNLGQRLTSFIADASGNVTGATGDLQLDTANIAPKETSQVSQAVNLDASATRAYAHNTTSEILLNDDTAVTPGTTIQLDGDDATITKATTLVDSYGLEHSANLIFTNPTDLGGGTYSWDIELEVDGNTEQSLVGIEVGVDVAEFSWSDGTGNTVAMTMDTSVAQTVAGGGGTSDLSITNDGRVQGAFDPTDPNSYNNSTSMTVYDSLGASHLATSYYRLSGTPNQWEVHTYLDDTPINSSRQASGEPFIMNFTGDGVLTSISDGSGDAAGDYPVPPGITESLSVDPGNGASNVDVAFNFSEVTQYGADFSVFSLSQDGYTTGRLSGLDISESGVIFARYTNGQAQALGQVALSNFGNPQGLRQLGDTTWGESYDSGPAITGSPGTGSLGLIQSGALEGSNVDISAELVNMITAQRNFQANAQVIRTNDTVTQTIINIR